MTTRSPSGKPVPRSNGTSPGAAAARGFLETYGPLFGIDDEASMDVASTRPAAEGRRTVKFRQTHKGIPVIAGELNVGLDAKGNVLYASGEAVDTASVDVSPAVPAAAAVRTARTAAVKAHGVSPRSVTPGAPELAIYDPRLFGGPGPGRPRLVWRTEVASNVGAFDELVLVDAHSGVVDLNFDQHAEAKNRRVCDRNNVVGAPEACTSGFTRVEGQGATGITDVDRAYDFRR